MTQRSIVFLGLIAASAPACGGDDGGGGPGGPPKERSFAPRCADAQGAGPRDLLAQAVVDVNQVKHSLVFGGMDPGSLAPFNFELGFLLENTNVEVRAPADLYIRTLHYQTYTRGSRAGETDFGMSFDICADDEQSAVVEGDLAHITAIEPEIRAILDGAELDCQSKTGPEEDAEDCTAYLQEEGLVIEAGTLIGTAGGTGQTDYRPGLDFNLLDSRYPNAYVNPDRLGSEEGPGRAFRYGACVYEYFPPALRDGYIDRIGANDVFRDSAEDPCGTMSIGIEGTAAGIWIRADKADLVFNDAVFDVIANLLILGPHPHEPGDKEVLSSELSEFNEASGLARLMAFPPASSGDVNVSIYDMEPETMYCLAADPEGDAGKAYYYLQLGSAGDALTVERLQDDCSATAQGERSFTDAAVEFVR